jgi:succinate dehydrogenase / fumarate reductase membrane anchor subunit
MKAAFTGLPAWALQRATALVVLGWLLYFVLHLLAAPPASWDEWRAWVLHPAMRLGLMLFFAAAALHAWVGVRDVILDYIKPLGLRLAALLMAALWLAATTVGAAAVLSMPR